MIFSRLIFQSTSYIVLLVFVLSLGPATAERAIDEGWVEQFDGKETLEALRIKGWNVPQLDARLKQDLAYVDLEKQKRGSSSMLVLHAEQKTKLTVVSPPMHILGEESINISASMRVEKIVTGEKPWYTARIALQVLDINNTPIATLPVGALSGTQKWVEFERRFVLPRAGRDVRMILELNRCSGTVYFDNIRLLIERPRPPELAILDRKYLDESSVLPVPLRYQKAPGVMSVGVLNYRLQSDESKLLDHLREFSKIFKLRLSPDGPGKKGVVIQSLDTGSKQGAAIVNQLDHQLQVVMREPQSYLLSVSKDGDGRGVITLLSKTDVGRYYAFQTAKQLARSEGGRLVLPYSWIVDAPRFKLRGVVFGDFRRWFQGEAPDTQWRVGGGGARPYRDWARELKLNFVWLTGWAGVYERTVMPLSQKDIVALREFVDDCDSNFVTPSIGFRPYRQTARINREKGGVVYGSKEDIDGIVSNYESLYRLGVRNFHMAFDDQLLEQVLQYPEDLKSFASEGQAHRYFVDSVYKELRRRHDDIIFRVIVIPYKAINSVEQQAYIRELRKLPSDIEFIWVGNSEADAKRYRGAVGNRGIMAWSNFYPNTYSSLKDLPILSYPFAGMTGDVESQVTGIVFHPLTHAGNPQYMVAWSTAADYMWRGIEYDPVQSLARAVMGIVGTEAYRDLVTGLELATETEVGRRLNRIRNARHAEGDGIAISEPGKHVWEGRIVQELKERCTEDSRCPYYDGIKSP